MGLDRVGLISLVGGIGEGCQFTFVRKSRIKRWGIGRWSIVDDILTRLIHDDRPLGDRLHRLDDIFVATGGLIGTLSTPRNFLLIVESKADRTSA